MSGNGDNGENFRNKLVEVLKEHPEGLTIEDLAKVTDAHRQTATKHILWLEGAGLVYRRRVGAATLCYLKKEWERLRK
ncbi:MAG: helix-turn-helix transcriptional regulator [Candidatus Aenigmarchaeota archaeon]|nr:helix-turn-helix transcriptional regulator [Candidatus Aenigmarchaeota archaeon]